LLDGGIRRTNVVPVMENEMNGYCQMKSKRSERGVALIIALLALLLISAVLMGMVLMSSTETNVTSNFRDEQTAFFASKAGIEEVRDRMRSSATNSLSASLPTTALPGTANGVLYVTNPASGETVTPWLPLGTNYPDDEICKEVTCTSGVPTGTWYTSASASTSYAPSPILPWKWVRVMAKANKSDTGTTRVTSVDGTTNGNRVCWAGSNEIATALGSCNAVNTTYKPVYELTALAVTSSGSRRMTQYEITQTALPALPGAMIFDGPTPTYSAPNSNAFGVSGNDANLGLLGNGSGCPATPGPAQPAVGGFDNASATTLVGDIPKPAKYTGAGGSPSVQNVNSNLGPLNTVDGLQALVNSVTAAASPANTYTGATSSLTNPGTGSAPVTNVVNGDLTVGGGFSGAGILLVTGTLTMSGNPSYTGIILVIGKGVLNKNGGGNGTMDGSILVANMNDSLGHPIPFGTNHAPGSPTINWNGGGNASINYDACTINALSQSFPYQIVAQRELIY
jgi:Tfp pilus assembly protein PilX